MPRNYKKVTIENATIMFENFSGRQTDFNPPGMRNFNVVIPPEHEEAVRQMGYNVKTRTDRDGNDISILKVNVSYRFDAPKVEMVVGGKKKVALTEDDIGILDSSDLISVDLSFYGNDYNKLGRSGTSAYLDSLYAIVEEDELEAKYSDIPYAN